MNPGSQTFTKFSFKRFNNDAGILGRIGNLETRFARSSQEVRAAQALRYNVFYREMGATADAKTRLRGRDQDRHDQFCDHLLVLDKNLPRDQQIVGTYRLMDAAAARAAGGFYSQTEFDLAPLLQGNYGKHFLELGRSCIAKPYRSKRTIELMWQGIWASVLDRNVDVLFGCASFAGTSLDTHRQALAWLGQNAPLATGYKCPAKNKHGIALSGLESPQVISSKVFAALPPLLKGYLRVGAKIGSHAVIDHQFGTMDVLVVLDVAQINSKYIAHYGADASRFAA